MARVEAVLFNVDNGDSTLIKITDEQHPPKWVLIDCNLVRRGGTQVNPAFDALKRNGVTQIDLLVVTHLHSDHYNGLDEIIAEFKIAKVAIPPFVSARSKEVNKQVFSKFKKKILEADLASGGAAAIGRPLASLASLLNLIVAKPEIVEEVTGPEGRLRVPGCDSLVFTTFLPMRALRGVLLDRIMNDKFELDWFPEMNDSSVVLQLEVHGHRLLWTADATLSQWIEHRHKMRRDGVQELRASVAKVPHHGSRHNSEQWLYEYLLGPTPSGRHVLVSANGRSHPHDEFFKIVVDNSLVPFCTNLAEQCGADVYASLSTLSSAPSGARQFLLNYGAQRTPVTCQGDISVTVDNAGLQVANSTGFSCLYSVMQPRPRRVAL